MSGFFFYGIEAPDLHTVQTRDQCDNAFSEIFNGGNCLKIS